MVLLAVLFCTALTGRAATVTATFASPSTVPVTAAAYTASGHTVDITLDFAPAVGTTLTVVNNTGPDFIAGAFDNLAPGQAVALEFGGNTYDFVADYHGGTGNDLVLTWAVTRALAWGWNELGQLGDATKLDRTAPVLVDPGGVLAGRTVVALAAGETHSLALAADGTLAAWGNNASGQLGNHSTNDSVVPVAVLQAGTALAGRRPVAVAAGAAHSVALCDDGTVVAWGYNVYGQLGDGSTFARTFPTPVTTAGTPLAGRTVVAVAAGSSHTLALCSDGTLVAWGLNVYGQLGDGTTTNRFAPVTVSTAGTPLAGRTVVAITAGRHFSLALCSDGTVAGWGDNSSGQLGDNTLTVRHTPVAVVQAGTPLAGRMVVAISAGGNHVVARCTDGTLAAWGYNAHGQLGDGTTVDRRLPVAVTRAATPLEEVTVTAIAAGTFHSVALGADGSLAAWGRNNSGQLGDGTQSNRHVAASVTALGDGGRFTRIFGAAHAFHAVALAAFPPAPEIALFTGAGTAPADERSHNAGSHLFTPTSVGSSSAAQTFTVQNKGTALLTGLVLTLAGAQAGDFSLGNPGAATLAPGATTTFTVTFAPTASGLRTAQVQIASNDTDESPFVLHVSGDNPAPEIRVFTGNSTAAFAERTSGTGTISFDPATVGGEGAARTFTIQNVGTADLAGLIVSTAGPHAGDFTFTAPAASTLVPGGTTTFTVTFAPTGAGTRAGQILLAGNDADENPFVISVAGTGYIPGGIVSATYTTGTEIAVRAADFTAAGKSINVKLAYAPPVGTQLLVVDNTGLGFITGTFDGLPHGQFVELSYGGIKYPFVANYHGGTGNDLVLVWAQNRAFAWGYNAYSVLGDGTTTDHLQPEPLAFSPAHSGRTLLALAPGGYHALAVASDGTLSSWGSNAYGQLGIGHTAPRSAAGLVTSAGTPLAGRMVIAAAAGDSHSVALCADGTLVTWGRNHSGQLGDCTTTDRALPVAVTTAGTPLATRQVVAVAAGAFHCVVLCSDGTLVAWGQNNAGQVGDGTTTQRTLPVLVTTAGTPLAGRAVVSIAAAGNHNLALCSDGTLVAWGDNFNGQIGDGTTTNRSVPVAVTTAGTPLGGKTVTRIAVGSGHSLAVCSDGTLAAWGWNTQGQLGDGTTTQRTVPTAVATGGTILAGASLVALAGGSHHSLALTQNGGLAAWGYNNSGQLGDGTMTLRAMPTAVISAALAAEERYSGLFVGSDAFLYTLAVVSGPPVPDIAVFDGSGADPAAERQHGSGRVFPDTALGASSVAHLFTIKNVGTATLSGLSLTQTGAHAGDYVVDVTGLAASLEPGATTTFSVVFSPTASGFRAAAVQIASNDPVENPFVVSLGNSFQLDASAGVISYWPLNENTGTTTADLGAANNPGTLMQIGSGTSGWTAGKVGSAAAFTGAGAGPLDNAGFITAGHVSSLDFDTTSAFTISAWMKVPPGSQQDSAIVGKMHQYTSAEPNHTGYELHYFCGGTAPGFASRIIIWLIKQYRASHIEVCSTIPINDGAWHQVAFTYDGSGRASGVKIYVDGELDPAPIVAADTLGTNSIRNTVSFNIGARDDGSYHGFTGAIDEVQVYDHVLTATEMRTLYQNPGSVVISAAPEIAVFDGADASGAERQSGSGSATFATTTAGTNSDARTFTIHNTGTAPLTGLALSVIGSHSGDFFLGALGATTLAAGETTTFTATFSPTGAGLRTATVRIVSSDADENPFTVEMAGTGLMLSAQEIWRNTHFGTTANTGVAANFADPDGDGRVNLLEFALALDPHAPDAPELPAVTATATEWVFTYRRTSAADGVMISVEASTDLTAWGTGLLTRHELIASASGIETWQAACLRSTSPKVFFRLRITAP
ncbi:MAG: choice-of-anchor D domain-containing protein [Candidatus Didemnitutus sp.]|nr:choice-of-anchor D domain-containing protein [Candidatus Didemnitutus sp.]